MVVVVEVLSIRVGAGMVVVVLGEVAVVVVGVVVVTC